MTTVQTVKIFDESLLEGIAPGTWVAIAFDQESVVATGETLEEALQEARQKGEAQPCMYKIPPNDVMLYL